MNFDYSGDEVSRDIVRKIIKNDYFNYLRKNYMLSRDEYININRFCSLRRMTKKQLINCIFIKSQTKVGCGLITENNNIGYFGCNFDFEWGNTIHAEQSAITKMICSDCWSGKILLVYIYCEREMLTPCGACRDKIMQFALNDEILICLDNGKSVRIFKLKDLIPYYPKR